MNQILKVSLRQNAVFIPAAVISTGEEKLTHTTSLLVANLSKLGFAVSEPLLKALNGTTPGFQSQLLETFREVMGVNKNWTPLVKSWDTPTGESLVDHVLTFFANVFKTEGTRLSCGHIIPANTFPLERYNGCPFCGMPFVVSELEHYKQGSEIKVLELWMEEDANAFLTGLLASKTALDATQADSLKLLLSVMPVPDVKPAIKETAMIVISTYVDQQQPEKAQALFVSPADILRYLWYKHTGFLQVIEPKTIIRRKGANSRHLGFYPDNSAGAKLAAAAELKLKYTRKDCLLIATWLNNLEMDVEKICETMHPRRGMWVRFIRALRLAEYSKRKDFEQLAAILDSFYNEKYEVWQGYINHYRLRNDAEKTLELLKQRPGLFARSLFSNMLWFGNDIVIPAFAEIADKVPVRLIFTLNMHADTYFDKAGKRSVKPLGGNSKTIPANPLVQLYDKEQLRSMKSAIEDLCMLVVKKRFTAIENTNKTIYIDPLLFKRPVSIGDRSTAIQDLPAVLMGTRFAVAGNTIRLFMQWGAGLPAQHMDMDLSCLVAYESRIERCSFSSLAITGCKHSGDIRSIPHKVGTAEYIEIDIQALQQAGAKYVSFACNAYSTGSITPNMVIGWMNSAYPMMISEKTGVAYDPSCVQQQVRVVSPLNKGLVFGVLDIAAREIIWLEIPFAGQLVQNLDTEGVTALLKKLDSKLSIGALLRIKAEAQHLQLQDTTNADEVYTIEWAANTAAVTKLLVD